MPDSRVPFAPAPPSPRITAVICALNEQAMLPACLHSVLAQDRPPDEVIVVDNASTDATGDVARAVPGVRVIVEPRRGLTYAREAARQAATGDILAWLDADCRAPRGWLATVERRFDRATVVAVTGPFRYYDWHWRGRALLRLYDTLVAPVTHVVVRDLLGWGALLYGGNFAVRRSALDAIGGFDTSIAFHGEDTNLGRRLHRVGRVVLARDCVMHTSARRYAAMGTPAVLRLYARNFWHEVMWHRPADTHHVDVRS